MIVSKMKSVFQNRSIVSNHSREYRLAEYKSQVSHKLIVKNCMLSHITVLLKKTATITTVQTLKCAVELSKRNAKVKKKKLFQFPPRVTLLSLILSYGRSVSLETRVTFPVNPSWRSVSAQTTEAGPVTRRSTIE